MGIKQLSVKGLADFIAATPSRQRTIVRQFKYPKDDDARAKITYYREARDVVEAHHRGGHDRAWLETQAMHLDELGSYLSGRRRTRLKHNARAIRAYAANFAHRPFKLLPGLTIPLAYGDVRITVVPDLHVEERSRRKIVKLEFGVDPPSDNEIRVISQLLFEASIKAGLGLPSAGVLYLDVGRGSEHRGARAGSQMRRNIEDACKTISAIWEDI